MGSTNFTKARLSRNLVRLTLPECAFPGILTQTNFVATPLFLVTCEVTCLFVTVQSSLKFRRLDLFFKLGFTVWKDRNGTVRRRRFGDERFGDEMWNVFSLGMSPKCKSSHSRHEACRRKIWSKACPNRTTMRAVYPNVHTLIQSMLTTSCTNCVRGARCLTRWRTAVL